MEKPIDLALKYYGLEEIPGKEHEKMIIEMFKYIGHSWVKDDETAWCACFVNYCLKKTGYLDTGKLNARSFLDLPNAVIRPELGDIMIYYRIEKDSPYGHVNFFLNELWPHPEGFYGIGGNQNNMVNVQLKHKTRLLGIRRPLKNT